MRSMYEQSCESPPDHLDFQDPVFCSRLLESASLVPISYMRPKHNNPDGPITHYQEKGYYVTFFSPSRRLFWNFPETFILSSPDSRDVFIVFTGSEATDDWVRNIWARHYPEVATPGASYIPPGAGGIRSGVRNLLYHEFVTPPHSLRTSILNDHWMRFHPGDVDALTQEDAISIYIVGHSQGAGIAQVAATVLHGLCTVEAESGCTVDPALSAANSDIGDDNDVGRFSDWPYAVRGIFAYAPPYIISRSYEGSRSHWATLHQYQLVDRTVMIIREGDPVPTLYNAAKSIHFVEGQHFGRLLHINRRGDIVRLDNTPGWNFNHPHRSTDYCASVLNAFSISDIQCNNGNEADLPALPYPISGDGIPAPR